MIRTHDSGQQDSASRERISTRIAAILRISATPDRDTALGEVLASAGARKGVIGAVDQVSVPQEPVFSSLTPEEEHQQLAWPGNATLFEHLRTLAKRGWPTSQATSARSASSPPGRGAGYLPRAHVHTRCLCMCVYRCMYALMAAR